MCFAMTSFVNASYYRLVNTIAFCPFFYCDPYALTKGTLKATVILNNTGCSSIYRVRQKD